MLRTNLLPRVLIALVGLPLIALVLWVGGWLFVALVATVGLLAGWEFHKLSKGAGAETSPLLFLVVPPTLAIAGFFGETVLLASIGLAFLISLSTLLLYGGLRRPLRDYAFTLGGIAYLGIPLSLAVMMRGAEFGMGWIALALIVAFSSDTSAYTVGRLIGKRPLAPSISGSKTWEGAIGGLFGAVGASCLTAWLLGLPLAFWSAGVAGVLFGVLAQCGDLAESMLKRSAGIKDASGLIPGHGGLLDRLDSVVFTLVAVYYIALGYW